MLTTSSQRILRLKCYKIWNSLNTNMMLKVELNCVCSCICVHICGSQRMTLSPLFSCYNVGSKDLIGQAWWQFNLLSLCAGPKEWKILYLTSCGVAVKIQNTVLSSCCQKLKHMNVVLAWVPPQRYLIMYTQKFPKLKCETNVSQGIFGQNHLSLTHFVSFLFFFFNLHT